MAIFKGLFLKNISLDTPIENILRSNTKFAFTKDSSESIKEKMYKFRIECMPLLDNSNQLIDVFFWEDIFGIEEKRKQANLQLPVVIMSGGKGTRLKPLTNVIPKPLIPLGEKTIIEEIMNRFVNVGCKEFLFSVNYKAETIKHYFEQVEEKSYSIDYFQESKPLGTAGSLHLIKGKITTTFFVSNCDIIIDEDYS